MRKDEAVYRELFAELENFESRGVDISMNGCQASPLQVVTAYMTKEEGTYMRDYVMGRDGSIKALGFTDVNNRYSRAEIPL